MTCLTCGRELPEGASVCPVCRPAVATAAPVGAPSAGPGATHASSSAAGAVAMEYMNVVKASSKQAISALQGLAGNPVGALKQTYDTLGDAGALRVGVSFGVVSVVCFLLGGYLMLPSFIREDFFQMVGFGGVIKCIIFALMPFVCTTACGLGLRKAVGSAGGIGGDCFIAGTALLPISIWALLSGIVGLTNVDFIGILTVFAFCIAIMIFYAGYTQISMVPGRLATYAVPLTIVLSLWLSSVVGRSIISTDALGPTPRSMRNTGPSPFGPGEYRFDFK